MSYGSNRSLRVSIRKNLNGGSLPLFEPMAFSVTIGEYAEEFYLGLPLDFR